MYSLISKRTSLTPRLDASAFAVSVLPVPVGPINTNAPTGLSSGFSPAWLTSILSTILSIARSCPYTTFFRLSSRCIRFSLSFSATCSAGISIILESSYCILDSLIILSPS